MFFHYLLSTTNQDGVFQGENEPKQLKSVHFFLAIYEFPIKITQQISLVYIYGKRLP